MKKVSMVFGVAIFLGAGVYAQDSKIESDRPGETNAASLAEKGYLHLETGFRKDWQKHGDYVLLNPEATIRYGLVKRIELRVKLMAETDKFYSKQDYRYGLMPVKFGFKAQIAEEKGLLPQTSFLGEVGIPKLASESHQTDHVPAELRLLFENTLQKKLKLNYNVATEWDGDGTDPDWLYSISPEFEISEKLSVFLEEYGIMHNGEKPEHYVDGGIEYYLARNIKIDLFGGIGLSSEASDYFISSGVSFRFK
ncbi:MAG TPA: transporter [Flavitalea sp.]|nr:transporter [Flavitalea sp.]